MNTEEAVLVLLLWEYIKHLRVQVSIEQYIRLDLVSQLSIYNTIESFYMN